MLPLLDKCNSICKVLILFVIIAIAVYFIYSNEKNLYMKTNDKEQFSNNPVVEQKFRQVIMQIYNEYLLRDPQEFEIMKARSMMAHIDDTKPIINAIRSSSEFNKVNEAVNKISSEKTSSASKDSESNKDNSDSKNDGENPSKDSANKESDKVGSTVSKTDLSKRMDTYRDILKVYEVNLERLPNMKELNYYTYRLLTDSEFSLARLEKILQSSQEYEILVKNQKNSVHAELPGNVTEAQLSLEVRKVYKDVFQKFPDKDVEQFLKYKYVEYRLDIKKLEAFVKLMKGIDEGADLEALALDIKPDVSSSDAKEQGNNASSQDNKNDKTLNTSSTDPSSDPSVSTNSQNSKSENNSTSQNTSGGSAADSSSLTADAETNSRYRQNVYNIINPSARDMGEILQKIEESNDCMDSCKFEQRKGKYCISPYNASPYKDELYENLKSQIGLSSGTGGLSSKNSGDLRRESVCKDMKQREKNLMAELQNDRNLANLKYACTRNSYFLNIDDDIAPKKKTILPSNALGDKAAFGTMLSDAADTKVGSIMPRFIYKEYTP